MLLSQAMLKSTPEMTKGGKSGSGSKVRGSSEPDADAEASVSGHNHRQRSASLFLSPGQNAHRVSIKDDSDITVHRKLSSLSPESSDEVATRKSSRTGSQPPAIVTSRRATTAHHSPPASIDFSKRRNTTMADKHEKKSLKQMFKNLTTKNDVTSHNQTVVEVHPYTDDPTIAWEILRTNQPVKIVKPMNLDSPIYEDRVRFVCISDTHARSLDKVFIPDGDVLLVAGDFTSCGHPKEIIGFNRLLGTLPHRYKIVICGNHELPFDSTWNPSYSVFPGLEKLFKSADTKGQVSRSVMQEALFQENVSNPRQLLTNCIFLEDSMATVFGLKIYGSPWVPKFDGWAFNVLRGQQLLDKWNRIPANVDVLLTHTPPLGHGDLTRAGVRSGCVELLNSIRRRIRPKYHVFGHIHEGYGCTTDGYTKFINACTCDTQMKPTNLPVLFDIALPVGERKN